MDRRTPLLVNRYEIATDAALNEAAENVGLQVCMKVRLGDVLNLRSSGLSNEEFGYATRAHLDFVVTDAPENLPQFAVEFDGRHHRTDAAAIRRDEMKDRICARLGLPLLRIDAAFLRRRRRFTLIGLLIEVWATERAFYAAQETGQIPYDEPFCYFSVLETSRGSGYTWAYSLDEPARTLMVKAHADGLALDWVPEERTSRHPFAETAPDEIECYTVLPLHRERYIIGHARLRNFKNFGGLPASQLVSDLAVADAGVLLERYIDGEHPPTTADEFAHFNECTKDWWRQGAMIGPYSFSSEEYRARHS